MTDLISRQAAIEAVGDVHPLDYNGQAIVTRLKELPTIDQVKHGKWMAIGNTGLAACECGYITDRYSIYNYCPNCGARMSNECAD